MANSTTNRLPAWPVLGLLGLGVALLVVVTTGLGFIDIPAWDVVRIIAAKLGLGSGKMAGIDQVWPHVVMEVRLPRILTSAIVGAGLAVAGAVFQGLLLNPLADPYTLGVSAGAAFGASLALFLGLAFAGIYTVPLLAFAGAIATLGAVIWLARSGESFSSQNLILSGVIVAAILAAGIGLIKYLAEEQVAVIIFWLMGSFASRTWLDVSMTLGFVLLGGGLAFYYARDLNVMALGSRTAGALGVDTARVRLVLLLTASLMTSVCVSVSGIIGFVGLIIPHLMRFIIGPDNRILIPASALAGAALMLGADTLIRVVLPGEVPIGVLTALIGGPYFCYIFRRRQLGKSYG